MVSDHTTMIGKMAVSSGQVIEAKSTGTNVMERETFQEAFGGMLFGQMLASMRKSLPKPAYFHGGQGEEMFQAQLDQEIASRIATSTGASITDSLYERYLHTSRR